MIRRQFLRLATLTGATGLASFGALEALEKHHVHAIDEAKNTNTVTWHVRGFTCITCAVGLETMLRQQKGVTWAKATYPDALVAIKYDSSSVSEAALRKFISEIGFTAEPADHA